NFMGFIQGFYGKSALELVQPRFACLCEPGIPRLKHRALVGTALRRHKHSSRQARLDIVLLEAFFNPPSKFSSHGKLLSRTRLHQNEVFDFAITHPVDSWNLNVSHDIILKLRIMANFLAHLL